MSMLPAKSDAQPGLILKGDQQAVVGSAEGKTAVADVKTHAATSGEETDRSRPQSDVISRRESTLNPPPAPNDGRIDLPMNDSARITERGLLARPASLHSEGHASLRGDKDNVVESKMEAASPIGDPAQSVSDDGNGESKVSAALLRSLSSSFDVMKHFSGLRTGQNGSLRDQAEIELPQAAAAADRQVTGGSSTESIMAGTQGGVGSSPPPPPPFTAPFASHAQPAMPGHDPADKSAQVMARSVVFDVAQPDLGHVNIRVAMTNDVVHTHLSADRPEVGQFLISGQDRLQAAFQANGLDMGQFRVDIDRQSGGRSFHHGPSQEQGQTWNQGSQGMNWGQSSDRQDEQRTSLHGLLNVVA
ncbi:MAG TPA: flagellar hook-length control protein FliK [Nitrospira sp.]|nr:flagellar hook-length control protein FliK [Nitrospira sp.]